MLPWIAISYYMASFHERITRLPLNSIELFLPSEQQFQRGFGR